MHVLFFYNMVTCTITPWQDLAGFGVNAMDENSGSLAELAAAVTEISPVTDAMLITPLLYAADVISTPPIITVTLSSTYPASAVRLLV